MNAKARIMEINLRTLGAGVILLGAWTYIKFALTYLMYDSQKDDYGVPPAFVPWIIAFVLVFAGIDFLLRLYIGLSARAEGKGKRKRVFYLIVTGFLLSLEIAAALVDIYFIFFAYDTLFTLIITFIIDLTSMILLLELMINAVGIRRLRRREATA